MRDVNTPEWLGLEVPNTIVKQDPNSTNHTTKLFALDPNNQKFRPKTYAETGEDVVNYVVGDSETDRAKEYRMRRGMPTQQEYAPEPTRYPSSAELEYHTRKERERNRNLATEIPSPMQSTTWDKVNKPSSGFVRAPKL